MENNKFFKFIWRTNGLLIFLTALFTLGILLFVTFETIIPTFQATPPPAQISETGKEESSDVQLKLRFERSQFSENYVFVDLYAEYDEKGFKSYNRKETRNLGVYDLTNGNTKWIFPNNNQHVDKKTRIVKTILTPSGKKIDEVVGHFLVTSTTSTNGDVVRDIWVSSIDGSDVKKILTDISGDPSLQTFGNNQARILFSQNDALKVTNFDIDTRTIGQSSIISIPQ